MVSQTTRVASPPRAGDPAWDIARLFPAQGAWSDEDYLALDTNHLVEFADGWVEVLPMPTMAHHAIVLCLYRLLYQFLATRPLGKVFVAPLRVRVAPGRFREPDVVFMLTEHAGRMGNDFWDGADLVIEVVSDDNRDPDWVVKRGEYARAGFPEYWIVDPAAETVTVLVLNGGRYDVRGEFRAGHRASSAILAGFEADVTAVLSGS